MFAWWAVEGSKAARHNWAPVCSRGAEMMQVPAASKTCRWYRVTCAVQLASQSLLRLSRLLVKVGMMWPVWAQVGSEGRCRRPVVCDWSCWPVAVLIVVGVALLFTCVSGASWRK